MIIHNLHFKNRTIPPDKANPELIINNNAPPGEQRGA